MVPEPVRTPNFVKLESDAGDWVGEGRAYNYTQANALISVTASGGTLHVAINGDEYWGGDFEFLTSTLQPGSYTGFQRFRDAAKGGLHWSGEGRGCNTLSGSVTVDSVTYAAGALEAIDLRFEQHCEGKAAALRGTIHWRADDKTAPAGPADPVPAGLWQPAATSLPATGNYIHLQSDAGDYIGQGQTHTYTPRDFFITVGAGGGRATVSVDGWSGDFQSMLTLVQLQPGYYADLRRSGFHNPAKGGLSWSGKGRGCNKLAGWFAVDRVTYSGGTLTELDLRFEQRCDGAAAALRGAIHWRAADTTTPSGPVNPPPAGLWKPSAGSLPATGNYVHLQSDAGDYIGQGQTHTYTPHDFFITVAASGGRATVSVDGWSGDFQAMSTVTQLQPGYYGDLARYPFHNAAKGGLSWSGQGRGCNTLKGWFVVDQVTYSGGALTALDLRFEQQCEGGTAALRGAIRWRADDPTMPGGPVNPPPAGLWKPSAGSLPATGNYVHLQSDPGDYIGQGQTHTYTPHDFFITVAASGGRATVSVDGWTGDFQAMSTVTQLQPGYYADLARYPFHNAAKGGLSWSGQGRGCNTLKGWFVVDQVTYSGGTLTALDLRFEQHCEGEAAALRGAIHWRADDPTMPGGPVNPPPAGLWKPSAGSLPATGNYVHLQSDAGDYIGQGQTHTYTPHDFFITVGASGGRATVSVDGWSGDFQAMSTLTQLQPGYYADLTRYPFHNAAKGGLSWSGQGRGCNTLKGWFVVDQVTYSGGTLTALDLRFEQHCEGGTAALRGAIHWRADDTTMPGGPVNPPPAGLWKPSAGSLPATGNYVHLQSDPGDYIGQGQTQTYTPHDFFITVGVSGGRATVSVDGWSGTFQAMSTLTQLKPGYYADLTRYPFHNAAKGGLDWSGQGRGCNTLKGWFVVDQVTYSGGTLTALDLRFEQHCEGMTAALRGAIHWRADDTTMPGGPVDPPPAGLWKPSAGSLPATGNYVHLQSDPGDYIGGGQTHTYTPRDFFITVTASGGRGTVSVDGWTGTFQAMSTLTRLQPGYYADLTRYPFHNAAKGGLDWSGQGRGCNTLKGWFVVDQVTYSGSTLTALDLRFEQHCEGVTAALRGAIHWRADDTTMPAGPVNPPPAGLWKPSAGSLPATGNYVHLQSDAGDYIGGGQTYTYTPPNENIIVTASGGRVTVSAGGWSGDFQAMSTLAQLQPGYYADLRRYPFHNPAKGGLSWSGHGRGCNTLTGWFVVDQVTYSGGTLTGLDLRFEQHCEGGTAALRGAIRWRA